MELCVGVMWPICRKVDIMYCHLIHIEVVRRVVYGSTKTFSRCLGIGLCFIVLLNCAHFNTYYCTNTFCVHCVCCDHSRSQELGTGRLRRQSDNQQPTHSNREWWEWDILLSKCLCYFVLLLCFASILLYFVFVLIVGLFICLAYEHTYIHTVILGH